MEDGRSLRRGPRLPEAHVWPEVANIGAYLSWSGVTSGSELRTN